MFAHEGAVNMSLFNQQRRFVDIENKYNDPSECDTF